jgi:Leucine-rich repeat (LRR) protein
VKVPPKTLPDSEGYHGIPISKAEANVLLELEEQLGEPIPLKKTMTSQGFGYNVIGKRKDLHVRRLGLHNKEIEWLPERIGNLGWLTSLFLMENHLTGLPRSIGECKKLQLLELAFNVLVDLPASTSKLAALRCLDLSRNAFTKFPECVTALQGLKDLWFEVNDVQLLPQLSRCFSR